MVGDQKRFVRAREASVDGKTGDSDHETDDEKEEIRTRCTTHPTRRRGGRREDEGQEAARSLGVTDAGDPHRLRRPPPRGAVVVLSPSPARQRPSRSVHGGFGPTRYAVGVRPHVSLTRRERPLQVSDIGKPDDQRPFDSVDRGWLLGGAPLGRLRRGRGVLFENWDSCQNTLPPSTTAARPPHDMKRNESNGLQARGRATMASAPFGVSRKGDEAKHPSAITRRAIQGERNGGRAEEARADQRLTWGSSSTS